MPNIYVLSKNGHPLMPCHHYGRIKRWLKQGKAVIKQHNPFVVQLCYDVEMRHSEGMVLGIDPGRTNIGLCATDKQGKAIFKYKNKFYILKANQTNCTKLWGFGCDTYVLAKKSCFALQNTGLVFL